MTVSRIGLFTGLTPAWLIMFRCTLGWADQVAGTPGFISSRWKDILVFFVIRLTLTLMNQINLKTDKYLLSGLVLLESGSIFFMETGVGFYLHSDM